MKKKFLFLMALLAVSLLALAEMTVYVYKKDGTKVAYVASSVDSIGFVDVNNFADGHEWVDLGLPSGTKWATCNVGADSPEDYGDYFAWGETTTKSSYTSSNYNSCYAPTLPLEYDAAYTNWGTSWRMPTSAELEELIANCTWIWTTQNGISGYIVTGPNGYSIFLPAAGRRSGSDLGNVGSNGCYWNASYHSTYDTKNAKDLFFASNYVWSYYDYRYYGQSVRPVLRKTYTITFDANGGEGSMDVISLREKDSVTLTANTFTKTNSTFIGWNTAADGSGTAYADQASITPNANLTLYAQWEETTTGTENGHEWVDLGLPSGTKWATCNVGADSPEEYGDHFAWGETATKSEYTCGEYKYYNIQCTAIYKYCALSSCFNDQEDNNTVLDLEDDVASANWGSDWRMPTKVEQEELSNTSYTVWTWITQNGVNGYKVTSKINGNSIFLPAAGSSGSYGVGSIGHYWSSSLYTGTDKYAYERSFNAYYLQFNSSGVYNYSHYRHVGLSIRPVLAE